MYKNVGDQLSGGLIDSCLKFLQQLLHQWTVSLLQNNQGGCQSLTEERNVIYEVEAFALVMLCQCRQSARKLAISYLKEVRLISKCLSSLQQTSNNRGRFGVSTHSPVIDLLDRSVSSILEKVLPILPANERASLTTFTPMSDFGHFLDKCSSTIWLGGARNHSPGPKFVPGVAHSLDKKQTPYIVQPFYDHTRPLDLWGTVLGVIFGPENLHKLGHVLSYAWPICYSRLYQVFTLIDPR
ncbi:hypothetical protein Ciccas_001833 [Cichlidogyrus casuarinus]|uniref:Uncharacterized protein n=1 Tax=Cichlidogyrus casuarinus TaxID=1844966 RepID=A0ABD2QIX0_9PLAT